jgi:hypothetical protein
MKTPINYSDRYHEEIEAAKVKESGTEKLEEELPLSAIENGNRKTFYRGKTETIDGIDIQFAGIIGADQFLIVEIKHSGDGSLSAYSSFQVCKKDETIVFGSTKLKAVELVADSITLEIKK